MAKVFISYSRTDLEQVRTLAQHLHTGGYDTWFDQDLSGGQQWWNEVLRQIRECDVFLAVVSERFTRSEACQRELRYATALGKPLLPVFVEHISTRLLGPVLGQVQGVDYISPSVESALRLMSALRALPAAPALPQPLPSQPEVPVSYLDHLKHRVETPEELRRSDQLQLLADLKDHIHGEESQDARRLLTEFRNRRDLMVSIRQEIDDLLAKTPHPPPEKPPASGSKTSVKQILLIVVLALGFLAYCASQLVKPADSPQAGSVCATQYGSCALMSPLPRGMSCYCPTPGGPVFGAVQ